MNKLEQLRTMTTVVADTGDIDSIKQYKPTDATTNPSLLYKAAQLPQYQSLVKSAIKYAKSQSSTSELNIEDILDKIAVNFGVKILKIIPGRISTEVDARLSFDTEATVRRAKKIIDMYKDAGINKDRILIKIASTWEGIKAGEQLEKEGIHCNLTLLFGISQAIACADAGITLISPFVGRILDWFKAAEGVESYPANEDPGVLSVSAIYDYLKKYDYTTTIMGASFRNLEEILELAGCDLLTISPGLMDKLQQEEGEVIQKLNATEAKSMDIEKMDINEAQFRWMMNEDAMATEKLAEGIRNFTKDTLSLVNYIEQMVHAKAA